MSNSDGVRVHNKKERLGESSIRKKECWVRVDHEKKAMG